MPGQSKFLKRPRIDPKVIDRTMSLTELIDRTFLSYNAGRLREACQLLTRKMLDPDVTVGVSISGALTPAGLGISSFIPLIEAGFIDWIISTGANLYHDTHYAIGLNLHHGSPTADDTVLRAEGVVRIYDIFFDYSVLLKTDAFYREVIASPEFQHPMSTAEFHHLMGKYVRARERALGLSRRSLLSAAYDCGVPIYTSSPGDSSIGMNVAFHELMNGSRLMVDPNKDVNEVCAIILAAEKNGCVILGGGSPKNFYLQGQPTLWEVYNIPKGGNDYFIQITTDQVVWGGLSGATPAEAVSWGKVNPGVLPDTCVAYCDSTIAFPLFSEYAVGHKNGRRKRKGLVRQRADLVAALEKQARRRLGKVKREKREEKSGSEK
jgi:deoxyhypusine synthase